jgi:pyruvate/oxaloacetate carboxyltransferase
MLSQLKQAKMEDKLGDVLRTVPIVRLASGCPPLVTPTSQIVGVQAVSYVLDVSGGKEPYTTLSQQFVQLVKGGYGKTPIPVSPEFRQKITGDPTEVPYDTSQHKKEENPDMPEYGEGVKLAMNEKEELLLELFPAVAKGFLKGLRDKEYALKIEEEKKKALDELAEYYAFIDGAVEGDYQTAEETDK